MAHHFTDSHPEEGDILDEIYALIAQKAPLTPRPTVGSLDGMQLVDVIVHASTLPICPSQATRSSPLKGPRSSIGMWPSRRSVCGSYEPLPFRNYRIVARAEDRAPAILPEPRDGEDEK